MHEFDVVNVIVVLVGLLVTVGTPILKLTNSMNTLSGQVTLLLKNLDEFKDRYKDNLKELKDTDQDLYTKHEDHEARIVKLETRIKESDD